MAVPTSRLRRLVAACAVLAVTALGAMACSSKDDGGNANPARTGGVSPSGSAASPSAATTTTAAPPTQNPAAYPKTARVYAEWVLAAWRQHQVDWLGELTTPDVQAQIIGIPGPPEQTWVFHRCDGAAGSSYCDFTNANGDAVVLRVSNALLTKAHAIVGVTFEPTTFPTDGLEYAKAFITAWQKGNVARMKALSVASVVTYTATVTAPTAPSYSTASGGGGLLQVTVTDTSFHLVLDIGSTLLGTPHAVVGSTP